MGFDFNQFLYTSPTQEVRDNHEESLIIAYHMSLSETLKKSSFNSDIPSLEDVKAEVKNLKLFGNENHKAKFTVETY